MSRPRRESLRYLQEVLFEETFDWRSLLLGLVLIVGGHLLAYLALRPVLHHLFEVEHRVIEGAALMAGLSLGLYFLAGLVVGRVSHGETLKEPAVAAVLALFILSGLQFWMGMLNIIGLLLGGPLCFVLAYLGGLLGERWQRAAGVQPRSGRGENHR